MTDAEILDRTRNVATPVVLLDLSALATNVTALQSGLQRAELFYAVKCNPHPRLLETVAALGVGFEVASPAELRLAVERVPPNRLMCLHPIKSPEFVKELHARGVTVLAADCDEELAKIAKHAPGSEILVRVAVSNAGSQHPLDGKFGCPPQDAVRLLAECRRRGLVPLGTTMHVGTQCGEPDTWAAAITACTAVLREATTSSREIASVRPPVGLIEALDKTLGRRVDWQAGQPSVLSLGGGFPIAYANEPSRAVRVASRIRESLPANVRITAEPGRAIAASAGTLVATVLGIATRPDGHWAYLDAGFYQGLYESLPAVGGFRHPITVEHADRPFRNTTLAGPTCDGMDIIARGIQLPELAVGDRVLFHHAGAYGAAIASRFNGFPPPEVLLAD